MLTSINLQGSWELQLDEHKEGVQGPFGDTITLPNTTSHARKGRKSDAAHIGSLTDEYSYEGWIWLKREIDIPAALAGKKCDLYLERTRITKLWVDAEEYGAQDSLNAPHVYSLPEGLSEGKHTLTIRVDNTDYPTKGGHLTSVNIKPTGTELPESWSFIFTTSCTLVRYRSILMLKSEHSESQVHCLNPYQVRYCSLLRKPSIPF
ncbi:hypothetical protein P5G61_13880 [Paenibacillus sp. F6_3S_P_1C]|uniref:Glycosyl hydrolases family 2 sugar binding domain-containing protein n=1 Tax=Paenibacillus vandeheii TaxID=3035917 RepID=A0ABT8JB42_9BACL|nr:hypothetical protein [Paenibacillus vandeheii]MDN4602320.1 hypothetical protein [Paenibacillus vandeheii]